MSTLEDSFSELGGNFQQPRRAYRFPDNNSHPLSSFTRRGAAPAAQEGEISDKYLSVLADRVRTSDARTAGLAKMRDIQAAELESVQRNQTLEDSTNAFKLLRAANPKDPSFEATAVEIHKNYPRAILDQEFKNAFDYMQGVFTGTVKADQQLKRNEQTQQNMLDRQEISSQTQAVDKLGPQYTDLLRQEMDQLGPDASAANKRQVIQKIQQKAAIDDTDRKLAAAGLEWEARRSGDRGREQLFDQNTGAYDFKKAQQWLDDEAITKNQLNAANEILKEAANTKDPNWLAQNAEAFQAATDIRNRVMNKRSRESGDPAFEAVAGPTRLLERLNTEYEALKEAGNEKGMKLKDAEIKEAFAARRKAAEAHPGFNISTVPVGNETPTQAQNRAKDTLRAMALWPTGEPIVINGKKVIWNGSYTDVARGGQTASTKEPAAGSTSANQLPNNSTPLPGAAPKGQTSETTAPKAEAQPVEPLGEDAQRILEQTSVPSDGVWAKMVEKVEGGEKGSPAQEAVWGWMRSNAKYAEAQERNTKLVELYQAEKAANGGALPLEKAKAYEQAQLEIMADFDPETNHWGHDGVLGFRPAFSPKEREQFVKMRERGLALRRARQEALSNKLTAQQ
jgi:hypothetical protein